MFDIAPTELMLVAVVALVVIGPKDLPRAMRFVGQWVAKARGMARHFRSGIDEMIRHAEMQEMEKKWAEENARILREHPAGALTDRPGEAGPVEEEAAHGWREAGPPQPMPDHAMTPSSYPAPAGEPEAMPPADPRPLP